MKAYVPECGNWKCPREGKWQRSDLIVTDPNDRDQQRLAHDKVRCGVHGPGPEKRSSYGLKWGWTPIADITVQALAIRSERAKTEKAEADARRAYDEHNRLTIIATRYWKDYHEEPDYVLRYEEETSTLRGPSMVWSIYAAPVLAEHMAWAESHPEERVYYRPSPVVEITLRDRSPYDDVTYPVFVETRAPSQLTPKLVKVYTEALASASKVAVAMNMSLSEKHYGETKGD